jgi:hypothetical protein
LAGRRSLEASTARLEPWRRLVGIDAATYAAAVCVVSGWAGRSTRRACGGGLS